MRGRRHPRWFLAALGLLAVVPFAASVVRLVELAGDPRVTPENARFVQSPGPIAVHVVAAVVFWAVGAAQFLPWSWRGHRAWHRWAGRVLLVPAGLGMALSGLWMTLAYPWPEHDGVLLASMRVVVSVTVTVALLLGLVEARRRRFAAHRAWMARAYALGLGAGTQVFTTLPWVAVTGAAPVGTPRALLLGLGWLVNAAVVEWWLRRRPGLGSPGAGRSATAVRRGAPRPA